MLRHEKENVVNRKDGVRLEASRLETRRSKTLPVVCLLKLGPRNSQVPPCESSIASEDFQKKIPELEKKIEFPVAPREKVDPQRNSWYRGNNRNWQNTCFARAPQNQPRRRPNDDDDDDDDDHDEDDDDDDGEEEQ
ncbi:hypothetical protein WH47_11097 [Habropoda laboriosa]|uniref:Uncharacterized protein n=1 Tax=Habropoda laboriosa TaxID=597456 RepID=A0A0L7RAB9_9HYME|nr:hypothetical protein WH47_11097 [Habropoda laboriosa]